MSELKAIDDLYERRIRNGSDPYKIKLVDVRHPPVYLKSEADKVLAEKDKEIRHHKYKRCLAMARWCASRSASWCFDPADEQLHKSDFYDKWKFRWLKLAEKFKPNH